MIPNPCIEVAPSPVERPSVPPWFAEVVIIVQDLANKGLLEAFARSASVGCANASAPMSLSISLACCQLVAHPVGRATFQGIYH